MAIFLVVIALALTIYVLLPLYRTGAVRRFSKDTNADEFELLQRQKDKLYNDIRDLDFEFGIGKMAESDYRYLRGEAIKEVAEVIEKIESSPAKRSGNGHISDEAVEQWILSRREHVAAGATQLVECPSCHQQSIATAKFCMHCGGALT